jgi:hypothetical protein
MQSRLRANRGRRVWPEFRRALSVAIDAQVKDEQRLPVETTEHVRSEFIRRLKSRTDMQHVTRDGTGLADLIVMVERVATQVGDADAILLHQFDALTGAVMVNANTVLRNARRTWAVTGQDLFLTTADAADGLCLELNHEFRRDTYELHLWGRFQVLS